MKRRLACAGIALLWALVGLGVSPAGAEVSGNCTATIAGRSLATVSSSKIGDAIKVGKDDVVPVSAQSAAPITTYRVQMEFAGIRWTVAKGTANGSSWSKNVKVKTFTRYGAGVYKVIGQSQGPGACSGAALVEITGVSPLSTVVGLAGAVLAGLGAIGLIFVIIREARRVVAIV